MENELSQVLHEPRELWTSWKAGVEVIEVVHRQVAAAGSSRLPRVTMELDVLEARVLEVMYPGIWRNVCKEMETLEGSLIKGRTLSLYEFGAVSNSHGIQTSGIGHNDGLKET